MKHVVKLLVLCAASAFAQSELQQYENNLPSFSTVSDSDAVRIIKNGVSAKAAAGEVRKITASKITDATIVGRNWITTASPGAVTFPMVNADNTVTYLNATAFLAAIGAGSASVVAREIDGSPNMAFSILEVTNATLTDMGGGVARLTIGTGTGGGTWGSITGTLSAQTDLQAALDAKLATNGNGSGLTGFTDAQIPATIARDAEVAATYLPIAGSGSSLTGLTGPQIAFADTDNNWTATNVQTALEELDNVINGGIPNSAPTKVDWSQLQNVPAGIADGIDDGGTGGGGDLLAANNLSELTNKATARTNLQLNTPSGWLSTDKLVTVGAPIANLSDVWIDSGSALGVRISPSGTAADVSINLIPKGTGAAQLAEIGLNYGFLVSNAAMQFTYAGVAYLVTPAGLTLLNDADAAAQRVTLGVSINAAGFNGNLATTDDTIQEVAQKFDDFVGGGGSGDVTAAVAFGTDNALIKSDGTGKGIQSSGVIIDDSNNMSGIVGLSANSLKMADGAPIKDANDNELIIFDTVTGAVNGVMFSNAPTGNDPNWTASGDDANIGIKWTAKGTGLFQFLGTAGAIFNGPVAVPTEAYSDAGWNGDLSVPTKDALRDKIETMGVGSGDVTAAVAFGTDNALIKSDGTGKGVQSSGVIIDDSNNMSGIVGLTANSLKMADLAPIKDANENELLIFDTVTSAVNGVMLSNAATGTNPKWTASGDDTNIGIDWTTKGTGTFRFMGNGTQAGVLKLQDADNSNFTSLRSPNLSVDVNYILPSDDGDAGEQLQTDGAGNLTWEPAGSGGGASDRLSTLTAAEISITAATTATLNRAHIVSGTTADYTVTLPTAVGNTGKFLLFRIDRTSTKLFTLDGNATETVDGSLTKVMYAGETIELVSNGTDWRVITEKAIPMKARMVLTSAQSISTTTDTKILLNSATIDVGLMADPTTNNRINIRRAGNYLVQSYVQLWTLDVGEKTWLSIWKNGVEITSSIDQSAVTNGETSPSTSDVMALVAGDFLELYVAHNEGASVNTQTTAPLQPRLVAIELVP